MIGDAGSGNLQEDVALHSAHRRRSGKDDAKKETAAAVLNKGYALGSAMSPMDRMLNPALDVADDPSGAG